MPVATIRVVLGTFPAATRHKDKDGNTPIISACEHLQKNLLEVVGMLLEADPQNEGIKLQDKEGEAWRSVTSRHTPVITRPRTLSRTLGQATSRSTAPVRELCLRLRSSRC